MVSGVFVCLFDIESARNEISNNMFLVDLRN